MGVEPWKRAGELGFEPKLVGFRWHLPRVAFKSQAIETPNVEGHSDRHLPGAGGRRQSRDAKSAGIFARRVSTTRRISHSEDRLERQIGIVGLGPCHRLLRPRPLPGVWRARCDTTRCCWPSSTSPERLPGETETQCRDPHDFGASCGCADRFQAERGYFTALGPPRRRKTFPRAVQALGLPNGLRSAATRPPGFENPGPEAR
jgi:hypothetical protein